MILMSMSLSQKKVGLTKKYPKLKKYPSLSTKYVNMRKHHQNKGPIRRVNDNGNINPNNIFLDIDKNSQCTEPNENVIWPCYVLFQDLVSEAILECFKNLIFINKQVTKYGKISPM